MIGGIIIGDEIMRGKREDKHFRKLIELLAARGLKLDWAQYLGDSPTLITETLTFSGHAGHRVLLWRHRRHAGRSHAPVRRCRSRGGSGTACRGGGGDPRPLC